MGNNASNFQTIHLNDPGWSWQQRLRAAAQAAAKRRRWSADLDEVWRDFNNRIGSLFGRKGGGETTVLATVAACRLRRGARIGLGVIALVAIGVWAASGFIVQEGQVAVVTQFGKYKSTSAGFQWRLPYPIQSHETVNACSCARSKSVSAAARATRCCPRR